MKIILHYRTSLGGSSVVAEVADRERARAIVEAHRALGENAEMFEGVPRYDLRQHLAEQQVLNFRRSRKDLAI
jgi:hypothetical protein